MALKTDIGPRLYRYALAAATHTYTPLFDRAAMVKRITVDNPSANDLWTVTVGGRELMRFRVDTVGNQRPLIMPTLAAAFNPNWFDYLRDALGLDGSIPVPKGLSIIVASVGGATADIGIEAEEHDEGDITSQLINHYAGLTFLLPIVGRLNAAVAAVGNVVLDTQDAPAWIPNVIIGSQLPVGWMVELLALFLEGEGRNTFSGAANHQSTSQDIRLVRNGEQLLSRPDAQNANNGVLLQGSASAAGSANTVFGQRSGFYPPFQLANDKPDSVLPVPIRLVGGDLLQMSYDITGDVTGGADYSHAHQLFVARVTRTVA